MVGELSPRTKKAKETREKILYSARKLFRKYGYNNVHVQDILQDCNVSVGTFYHYFSSKSEVLSEISTGINKPFVYNDTIDYKSIDCIVCIQEHFHTLIQTISTIPKDSIVELYLGNSGNKTFLDQNRTMYQVLKQIIENFQELGRVIQIDPMDIVLNLFISVRGVIYQWIISEYSFDLQKKVDELVKIVFTYYLI